ncbi:MAG: PHP domain-containing protein [Lachnospiraceae bacterium]|nr:PHP domain-containing protein [Lachnospiraceae bacterium]
MKWNLHTHTSRCHHASGTEEEMILAAIRAGIDVMGFADHAPMIVRDDFVSGIRMTPEELPGYVDVLRELRVKYAGVIEIPIGLEAEYFPDVFEDFLKMVRREEVEFLILGQHYLGNEKDSPYVGTQTDNEDFLRFYVDQVCEAMDTGVFTYVAHPDLIQFIGDENVYEQEMRRLARHAAKKNMVLELNVNGARDDRNYPDPRFWKIAGEEGCQAVIGIDAHHPKFVDTPAAEEKCRRIAAEAGVPVLERVPLVRI